MSCSYNIKSSTVITFHSFIRHSVPVVKNFFLMEEKTVRLYRQTYRFQPQGITMQEQLWCARLKSCCLVGHNRSQRRQVCFKRAVVCITLHPSLQSFEAQRFLELDITLRGFCCPGIVHSPFEPQQSFSIHSTLQTKATLQIIHASHECFYHASPSLPLFRLTNLSVQQSLTRKDDSIPVLIFLCLLLIFSNQSQYLSN